MKNNYKNFNFLNYIAAVILVILCIVQIVPDTSVKAETAENTGSDEPEAIEIEASEEKISDNDTAAGGSAEDSNEKHSDKDEGALETKAVKPDETGEISV